MRKRRSFVDMLDNRRHQIHHRPRIRDRLVTPKVRDKSRLGRNQPMKPPRDSLRIRGRHDGADNRDAIENFLGGMTLVENALDVRLVDAPDANSLCAVPGLGDFR